MFVRKKSNKSGKVSVQVIDKSQGKYRVVKTLGSSSDPREIDLLEQKGEQWIQERSGQGELDLEGNNEALSHFLSNIQAINVSGTELLLGRIFDEIGFDRIPDELFRQLVLSRICFPVSKLKTTDHLRRYYGQEIDEDSIYRYMDKLHQHQKETIQRISYEHTLKVLGGEMTVVFYDVTTLYFEIDHEDEVRKTGFSKEGKHQNPQIVLGLLVSTSGYPLAYEIFEGNKFEGHTMLPVIDAFKTKYDLEKLVIVADSGLMSKNNIRELRKKGYEFILGARIKNEKTELRKRIENLELKDGESKVIEKEEMRLVINYSAKRAKKDKHNRERGLQRLEKKLKSGKLTKSNINNKGYNKYLTLEGDVNISIDREKFEADAKWDGLKGYLTNTDLSSEEIIENYKQLWKIEKAFRISKSDLRIRPVYHRLARRIEAHICIGFVAYKVYKELERQLLAKEAGISSEKAIDIARSIYSVKVKVPHTNEIIEKTLLLDDEQKFLAKIFGLNV